MLMTATGVVEDGSAGAASLPRDPAVTLRFARRTDVTLRVVCYERSGVPLSTVDRVFTLYVRPRTVGAEPVVRVVGEPVDGQENVVEFTISANATREVAPGQYVWTVRVVTADAVADILCPPAPCYVLDAPDP